MYAVQKNEKNQTTTLSQIKSTNVPHGEAIAVLLFYVIHKKRDKCPWSGGNNQQNTDLEHTLYRKIKILCPPVVKIKFLNVVKHVQIHNVSLKLH